MQNDSLSVAVALSRLPKAPTGIAGLDEIAEGGLPQGRPTLVAGAAGCGKTLLGIEFLVRGERKLERQRRLLKATITNLRTEFEAVEKELNQRGPATEARPTTQPVA